MTVAILFAAGLAGLTASGQVFMKVDDTLDTADDQLRASRPPPAGPKRRSIRVTSTRRFDPKNLSGSGSGPGAILSVIDLAHMPTGCATWPAYWMNSGKGKWPMFGEIDIIEGAHWVNATGVRWSARPFSDKSPANIAMKRRL